MIQIPKILPVYIWITLIFITCLGSSYFIYRASIPLFGQESYVDNLDIYFANEKNSSTTNNQNKMPALDSDNFDRNNLQGNDFEGLQR